MKETSQKRTVTVEGEKVVQFTPRYSLHEFLQGRENQEVYEVFMTKFAWCVVARKTEWQSRVLAAETDRDVLSVSDEAFALIVLENNWSRWIDVFNINGGKVPKNGVGRKTGENVYHARLPTRRSHLPAVLLIDRDLRPPLCLLKHVGRSRGSSATRRPQPFECGVWIR